MLAPIQIFGGKEGVGRTTLAAAFAWLIAHGGRRVLLVSTDREHSASALFDVSLGAQPLQVAGNLAAMELDGRAHAHAYVEAIRADVEGVINEDMRSAVERHLHLAEQAPGTAEAALFDRFAEIMTWAGSDYDHIVFDTAPTAQTLHLLSLPDMLSSWVDELAQNQSRMPTAFEHDDSMLSHMRQRAHRVGEARQLLKEKGAFNPVLVPERTAVEETGHLLDSLARIELSVGRLFVNRVLPKITAAGYENERLEQQAGYLADIREHFHDYRIQSVHQAYQPITDIDRLSTLSAELAM